MPKHDLTQVPLPTPEQASMLEVLAHRVQSAIAFFEGQRDAFGTRCAETEPKHLRVGVNSALVETSAVARLMFRKGLISAKDYYDTLIEVWEQEVDSYRERIKRIDPRLEI
jgi:hypothetical protein